MTSNDLKRLIGLCTLVLALLAGPALAGDPNAGDEPEAPAAYVDEDNDFSIVPPEGWETNVDAPGAVVGFLSPPEDEDDALRENFNVTVLEIDELPTPEELAEGTFDSVRGTFEDLELLLGEDTFVNGMPAVRIEYTCVYQPGFPG